MSKQNNKYEGKGESNQGQKSPTKSPAAALNKRMKHSQADIEEPSPKKNDATHTYKISTTLEPRTDVHEDQDQSFPTAVKTSTKSLGKSTLQQSDQPASFAIFSDELTSESLKPSNKSAPKASMAFQIFSDDLETPNPQSKTTVKGSHAVSHSTAVPFQIFSDDSKMMENTEQMRSSNARHNLNQNDDKSQAVPEETAVTADEEELHALLKDMGLSCDEDDGTINTRLARKDIDSMFCSPDLKSSFHQDNFSQPKKFNPSSLSSTMLSTDSPIVMPLRAFLGKSSLSSTENLPKTFGGSDLSVIKEVSLYFCC
jgi:hypothetical protein